MAYTVPSSIFLALLELEDVDVPKFYGVYRSQQYISGLWALVGPGSVRKQL